MGDKGIGGFAAIVRERHLVEQDEPIMGECVNCGRLYGHESIVRGVCPNCGRYIPV